MSRLIFKINKEIDFKNHLIQAQWREKTNFDFKESDKKYFDTLLKKSGKKKRFELFETYSANFYNKENKKNIKLIINHYQKLWNDIEKQYIIKMEKIHEKEFPYKIVLGIISTTPIGWGFNFCENPPWFACPNKVSKKFIKIAMHEIMHGFFQKYFMKKYKKKFNLNNSQVWAVQESLTTLLNLEFKDILPEPDIGYMAHNELRKKVEQNWIKYKDINKVLEQLCLTVKETEL